MKKKNVPIEVSARHIHITQNALEKLFGKGYKLKELKKLNLPYYFAAKETLTVQAGRGRIANMRIVGPVRDKTQIEFCMTDAFALGIKPPVKVSGNLSGTPGAVLIGPKGRIKIKKGIIIPQRHLHCNFEEAKKLGLKNGMTIRVKTAGLRSVVFNNVKVRVGDKYRLYLHLDTDEGNAAGIVKKGTGYILNT